MSEHGYRWDQVRSHPATEIAPGTVWVNPGPGTAYRTAPDGTVAGHGWLPLDGTAWTATEVDGDKVTARSHDGRTDTGRIPAGRHVLIVTQ